MSKKEKIKKLKKEIVNQHDLISFLVCEIENLLIRQEALKQGSNETITCFDDTITYLKKKYEKTKELQKGENDG